MNGSDSHLYQNRIDRVHETFPWNGPQKGNGQFRFSFMYSINPLLLNKAHANFVDLGALTGRKSRSTHIMRILIPHGVLIKYQ